MLRPAERQYFIQMQNQFNKEMREFFYSMGDGRIYNQKQRVFAFEKIEEHGIRGTARILHIPRRTLQRWCRKYHIGCRHCPAWVIPWAKRKRERKEFWRRRGYG